MFQMVAASQGRTQQIVVEKPWLIKGVKVLDKYKLY